jgi:CO dehydrogenase maturation factor
LNIVFVGKGGVGKSTLAGLATIWLHRTRPDSRILLVDADPACTLHWAFGMEQPITVGAIVEDAKGALNTGHGVPSGMTRSMWLGQRIADAVTPVAGLAPGVDLLAMGRGEGRGCYCNVNSTLRATLDAIGQDYDVQIMDTEAGMEHISRHTVGAVQHLVVVARPTAPALGVAQRIVDTAADVAVDIETMHLVLNDVAAGQSSWELPTLDTPAVAACIPHDDSVLAAWNQGGLAGLESGPAFNALARFLRRLVQ